MSGEETSAQVIRKIQAKDSKYRLFFVVLMILVVVGLGGVIFLQAQALQEFKHQSASRAAALKSLASQNLDAAGRTNSYIQCLGRFFAEADRVDLQLKDLDQCSYERGGNAVPGVDVTPTGTAAVDQTTAPSGSSQQVPTSPSSPQTPSNPAPTPPAITNDNTPPAVLGSPLCIWLTNICVL